MHQATLRSSERRATWFEIMKNNKQTPSLPPRFLFIRQFLAQNFSMLFIGLVSWSGIAGCLMNWLHLASSIKCVFCGEQVGKYHCVIWWWHVLSRIFKEKSFQKSPTYPPYAMPYALLLSLEVMRGHKKSQKIPVFLFQNNMLIFLV